MRIEANILLRGLLRLLNLQEVSAYAAMLVVDGNGNVRKALQPSVQSFQLDNIVSNTLGIIPVTSHIGLLTGSFVIRIDFTFGDLTHTGFRLSAVRSVEFSMISYINNLSVTHTNPLINLLHHSGTIVRLSDQAVFHLNAEDIEIEASLQSTLLRVTVRNNLHLSAIPAANAAFKCLYTISVKQFLLPSEPISE